MTWALILAHFAITGFPSEEACREAQNNARAYVPASYCIVVPPAGKIIGSGAMAAPAPAVKPRDDLFAVPQQ